MYIHSAECALFRIMTQPSLARADICPAGGSLLALPLSVLGTESELGCIGPALLSRKEEGINYRNTQQAFCRKTLVVVSALPLT